MNSKITKITSFMMCASMLALASCSTTTSGSGSSGSIGGSSDGGGGSTPSGDFNYNEVLQWAADSIPGKVYYDVDLPTLDWTGRGTIGYESSNTGVFSNSGVVNAPSSDADITVKISVTYDGETKSKDEAVLVTKKPVYGSSVVSANNASVGASLTATGVVTKVRADGYFMQDDSEGIFVYGGTDCVEGDEISVKGKRGVYNNSVQIIDPVTTVTSSDNQLPKAEVVTSLSSSTLNQHMAKMISYEGATIGDIAKLKTFAQGYDLKDLPIKDSSGNSVNAFIKSNVSDETSNAISGLASFATASTKIDLDSVIVTSFRNIVQLSIIDENEISVPEITQDEKLTAINDSIKDITSLNNKTVASDLVLPTYSLYYSVISWTSNNTSLLSNEGHVTRPALGESNASVELSYTIRLGDYVTPSSMIKMYIKALVNDKGLDAYYDGINFEASDATIKSSLKTLITNTHTSKEYATNGAGYGTALRVGATIEGTDNMELFYTGAIIPQFGSTWNKEHVFPKSISVVGTQNDCHNIRPTGEDINAKRSNYPYADLNGSGSVVYDADHPYAEGSSYCYMSGAKFEPRDEIKGDVARIIFYDVLRHGDSINNVGSSDMFKAWAAADPISDYERNMNESIQDFQGNRNPFIDYEDFLEICF